MKINNDFYVNKKIAFKNVSVFGNSEMPVNMYSSAPLVNNKPEKSTLKSPLPADKFNASSSQQISSNEIVALFLSLAAAAVVIGFGIAEIFKRP